MCCTRLDENTERKKLPKIRHLHIIAQLCRSVSTQLRHISTIRKSLLNSNISPTCLHNMANFGPLTAEIGWRVWGTPENFNGFRVFASLLQRRRSLGANQTLHDVWPSPGLVHYIIRYIFGRSCPLTEFCPVQNQNFARCKIHFTSRYCVLLYWQHYCTARQQRVSAKLRHGTRNGITELWHRAPPLFVRAAITLGIDPHSSYTLCP